MKSQVLTDDVLKRVVLDRRMQQKIPFLLKASNKVVSRGCRRCRKKLVVRAVNSEALANVRRLLYQSSNDIKQAVKNFLGADRLVFYFDGQPGYPQRISI